VPHHFSHQAGHHPRVRTREAFDSYLRDFILEFGRALPEELSGRGEAALALVSLCVGGVMLARAVQDPGLSDLILRACRAHVVPPQADGGRIEATRIGEEERHYGRDSETL
jgi:hypothetical protein